MNHSMRFIPPVPIETTTQVDLVIGNRESMRPDLRELFGHADTAGAAFLLIDGIPVLRFNPGGSIRRIYSNPIILALKERGIDHDHLGLTIG